MKKHFDVFCLLVSKIVSSERIEFRNSEPQIASWRN